MNDYKDFKSPLNLTPEQLKGIKEVAGVVDSMSKYTQNLYEPSQNTQKSYESKMDCPMLEICTKLDISEQEICTKGCDTRYWCSFAQTRIILLFSKLLSNASE